MAIWDRYLTDQDRRVFEASGWGQREGFGKRPVVLVIDVNYNFAGDRPEPIEDSIVRWRNSCGAAGWEAAGRTTEVLHRARARGVPVIFSTGGDRRQDGWDSGRWRDKNSRRKDDLLGDKPDGTTILPVLEPQPEDIIVRKSKPSVFFGSTLASYLVELGADSIIACGATTSGCVRATVVDAFSLNYRVALIEECTFDRGDASHAINLFDLDQKYADVVSKAEVIAYLDGLPEGLFAGRMPRRPAVAAGAG